MTAWQKGKCLNENAHCENHSFMQCSVSKYFNTFCIVQLWSMNMVEIKTIQRKINVSLKLFIAVLQILILHLQQESLNMNVISYEYLTLI